MNRAALERLGDADLLKACKAAVEGEVVSDTLTDPWLACWVACTATKRKHLLEAALEHAAPLRKQHLARSGAQLGVSIKSPGPLQAEDESMGIFKGKANSSGGGDSTYEIPPADNHPSVCVAIIDLGTQRVDGFQGAPAKDTHQVYLVWELTEAKVTGTNNNHLIGNVYTLSYHEKAALRLMLEGWRGTKYQDGEEIDLGAVLGRACLLSVIHQTSKSSGKNYAKIKGVAKLPKGMTAPKPQKTPSAWEMGSDDAGDLPTWLPYIYGEPVKEVVERAKEYGREPGDEESEPEAETAGAGAGATNGDADDDIAF